MRTTARTIKTLAALAASGLAASAVASPIIYQQDFESPSTVGKEWGQRGISNTDELGKFSKRMNNNELTLTVDTMNNQIYTLVFDLYLFDSWTGGNQNISVRAEGHEIFRETFSNTGVVGSQSYEASPDMLEQLGYGPAVDSAYRGIAVEFNGRNPSVTLRFMGQGLDQMGKQSWAIDNVAVHQGVYTAPSIPAPATAAVGLIGAGAMMRRRRRAAVVAGALAAGCAGASSAGVVVYQQDFENASLIGPEWSSKNTDHNAHFTRFSQRRTNEQVTLTLDTIAGQLYSLDFDLYLIDSWDGGDATWGQDRFNVKIAGQVAFSELLDNSMNSPNSTYRNPDEVGQFGFGSRDADRDTIYRGITLDFTATQTQTLIAFFGSGLQGKNDESWGIDNVSVTMAAVPAPATAGVILGAGALLARRRRDA